MSENSQESSQLPNSPRLTFERMKDSDLDDMARLLGDPEAMAFYPHPKSRQESLDWIRWNQRNYRRDQLGLWILREAASSSFIGDCGLTWQLIDGREDLELGYHVLREFQGQGFATEAARASRDLALSLGHRRLISIIHPENIASRRVAEKVGMSVERETVSRTGLPVVVYAGKW